MSSFVKLLIQGGMGSIKLYIVLRLTRTLPITQPQTSVVCMWLEKKNSHNQTTSELKLHN